MSPPTTIGWLKDANTSLYSEAPADANKAGILQFLYAVGRNLQIHVRAAWIRQGTGRCRVAFLVGSTGVEAHESGNCTALLICEMRPKIEGSIPR
jgi:hypothetical protein